MVQSVDNRGEDFVAMWKANPFKILVDLHDEIWKDKTIALLSRIYFCDLLWHAALHVATENKLEWREKN
jgi:hypothetical protein